MRMRLTLPGRGLLLAVMWATFAGVPAASGAEISQEPGGKAPTATADEVRKAVEQGTIGRLVTTLEEFRKRFGEPKSEKAVDRGSGEEVLFLAYDTFAAAFAKDSTDSSGKDQYKLFGLNFGKGWQELGDRSLHEAEGSRGELPPEPGDAAEAVPNLPKIDRRPEVSAWPTKKLKTVPKYDATSQEAFQVDLRMRDLRGLDLRGSGGDLAYATFDTSTVWPARELMPEDFDPKAIMEKGKNPGLGIRNLHARGITGKGVRIAIVDQPVDVDHVEYAGRIKLYEETNVYGGTAAQMHGPAVASIAAGKTVGVAPEAELFYIAAFAFDQEARRGMSPTMRDFTWYAKAVRRIIDINRHLPEGEKIRAISLSIGWVARETAYAEMEAAVNAARDSGLLVTSSSIEQTHGIGIHGLGREPMADPDRFESYVPGMWWTRAFESRGVSGKILIPMDSRTAAGFQGHNDYAFYRSGGWSWITPYLAGVYALACQVKPEVTPDEFLSLALETGRTVEVKKADGTVAPLGPIIAPEAIIAALEKQSDEGKIEPAEQARE